MDDIIQVRDRWYILAGSSRDDDRVRTLKSGDTFALCDRFGDVQHIGRGEQGLFHAGTRHLSRLELTLDGRRPILMNSSITSDNTLLTVDLTNPDPEEADGLPRATVHLYRAAFLWEGALYSRLRLENHGDRPAEMTLELRFGADFADIFEVRGARRPRRGELLPVERYPAQVVLGYRGLDGVVRRTRLHFVPPPAEVGDDRVLFTVVLPPRAHQEIYVTIACEQGERVVAVTDFHEARQRSREVRAALAATAARVTSSNEQFNDWLNRSAADLAMLVTATPQGLFPYAGIPWFATPFGRDGIITALQTLWLQPSLARGVLSYLAANQADEVDPDREAEPGKILHESRQGEMPALDEVPFRRYYGTVDATPLFVVLAGEYWRRTGDREFMIELWPHVKRALAWIDEYGDVDGDGFVEYHRHGERGLLQQGWKDSDDTVFHADGRLAEGPIALCEVQGYVYLARRHGAELARLHGERDLAVRLLHQAWELKARFDREFWLDDLGTYALALDGRKRPCRVVTSNAGHALATGIALRQRAERLVGTLLSDAMYSGWGVRTVAAGSARYNPMSYHNGSVWPHDNALVALGLARYGFKQEALRILTGMFDLSIVIDLHRLPELVCGFPRLPDQYPTLYPGACTPQAWASASVFALLQAALGISFSPEEPCLRFDRPRLPPFLDRLEVRGLQVGRGTIDLELTRHEYDVGVHVTRREGEGDISVLV